MWTSPNAQYAYHTFRKKLTTNYELEPKYAPLLSILDLEHMLSQNIAFAVCGLSFSYSSEWSSTAYVLYLHNLGHVVGRILELELEQEYT